MNNLEQSGELSDARNSLEGNDPNIPKIINQTEENPSINTELTGNATVGSQGSQTISGMEDGSTSTLIINDTEINRNLNTMPSLNAFFDDASDTPSVAHLSRFPDLIKFNPELGVDVVQWFLYFETTTNNLKLTDGWRIKNLSRYIMGDALREYLNNCLNVDDYAQMKCLLIERFIRPQVINFSEFTQLFLGESDDLLNYFHTKMDLGRKLGIETRLILDALTEGIRDTTIRQHLIINSPTTPIEWLNLVNKLHKPCQRDIKSKAFQNNRVDSDYQNGPNFGRTRYETPRHNIQSTTPAYRHWQPRGGQNYRYSFPPRPQGSRYSHNDMTNRFNTSGPHNNIQREWQPRRPQLPNYNRFRGPNSFNNNTRHNVHFHEQNPELPRYPCPICTQKGIWNAYHFKKDCSFCQESEQQET